MDVISMEPRFETWRNTNVVATYYVEQASDTNFLGIKLCSAQEIDKYRLTDIPCHENLRSKG